MYSSTKFLDVAVAGRYVHHKIVDYSTSFASEYHPLSDITFEENVIKCKISTGLSDKLYSSNIVLLLNPSRDPILSSGLNEIADS